LLGTAVSTVGARGALRAGVTALEGLDATLVPTELVAVTLKL
jgi:hypothetical protein